MKAASESPGLTSAHELLTTPGSEMDTVATNNPFIDLNYMFLCVSTYSKIHSTVKAENRKLVNRKTISIF
ncbi:hypothetical protein STEG23_015330 [Scotinomys teguina]